MLTFYYGTVKSGKSEELIRIYNNFKYEMPEKKVLVMKPACDIRDGREAEIFSRNGSSVLCDMNITAETNFSKIFKVHKPDVIIIDEVQFLNMAQAIHLVNLSAFVDIYVGGLRTDYRTFDFVASTVLLANSEHIREVISLCSCGKKAIYNAKFNPEGEQVYYGSSAVEIGDMYKGVCRKCYIQNKVIITM